MKFRGENFRGLLTCTYCVDRALQTITEKTFPDRQKTAKFAKVSRYTVILGSIAHKNVTNLHNVDSLLVMPCMHA